MSATLEKLARETRQAGKDLDSPAATKLSEVLDGAADQLD